MKLKVGDILICKTNKIIAGGTKLGESYYTKEKHYKVVGFMGYDNEIIMIENNLKGIVTSPQNVFFQNEIEINFYTKKEIRKLKLNEINSRSI